MLLLYNLLQLRKISVKKIEKIKTNKSTLKCVYIFFLKRIGVRELACRTGSIKTGKNDRHLEIIFEKFMEYFSKALHIFPNNLYLF